jgi:hypothetical protein
MGARVRGCPAKAPRGPPFKGPDRPGFPPGRALPPRAFVRWHPIGAVPRPPLGAYPRGTREAQAPGLPAPPPRLPAPQGAPPAPLIALRLAEAPKVVPGAPAAGNGLGRDPGLGRIALAPATGHPYLRRLPRWPGGREGSQLRPFSLPARPHPFGPLGGPCLASLGLRDRPGDPSWLSRRHRAGLRRAVMGSWGNMGHPRLLAGMAAMMDLGACPSGSSIFRRACHALEGARAYRWGLS